MIGVRSLCSNVVIVNVVLMKNEISHKIMTQIINIVLINNLINKKIAAYNLWFGSLLTVSLYNSIKHKYR